MATPRCLFEDIFEVLQRNPDGKYFDKVSRYRCKSELYGADLLLDVNTDLYPLDLGERYTVVVTQSLLQDVSKQRDEFDPDLINGQKRSLLDDYEYVMHGKVFKLDRKVEEGTTQAVVKISYGGLLMELVADHNKLTQFEMDSMVYLLMRKTV